MRKSTDRGCEARGSEQANAGQGGERAGQGKLNIEGVCQVLAMGGRPRGSSLPQCCKSAQKGGGNQRLQPPGLVACSSRSGTKERRQQQQGRELGSWSQPCSPAPQRCAAGWQQLWWQQNAGPPAVRDPCHKGSAATARHRLLACSGYRKGASAGLARPVAAAAQVCQKQLPAAASAAAPSSP